MHRVLQILSNFSMGGQERIAVHLMRTLSSDRFDVAAVSMFDPLGTDLEGMLAESGHPVWYLGKRPGFDARMFLRLDRVLREFRPSVVHTHTISLRYALPVMLFRRIPLKVHTVHNIAEKEAGAFQWIHWTAFRLGIIPVAIADEVEASLKRVYGIRRCPNIPNGIPVEVYQHARIPREEWRKREGFSSAGVLFVAVGRLMEQKNHPLLVRSFEPSRPWTLLLTS